MFWFFGREIRGILAPQPGIKHVPPELEGKVLTTGLPGKSHPKPPFKAYFYHLVSGFWKPFNSHISVMVYIQYDTFPCHLVLFC